MADKPQGRITIRAFPGLFDAVDAEDTPAGGAQEQVNVGIGKEGELEVRRGYREANFEDE